MRPIERKTLERILDLRDKLRDCDHRATQEIADMEKLLRELQLGIPLRFGDFFTWAKRAGRWALWENASLETAEPRDQGSTTRTYRVEFVEWLGDAFGDHVVAQLEAALARREAALHIPVTFHKEGLPKQPRDYKVFQVCGKSMLAGLTCTEEQGHPPGECKNWKSDAERQRRAEKGES